METARLRKLEELSKVQRLLETAVSKAALVPENAYVLRDRKALPLVLLELAQQAGRKDKVWSAWTENDRIWLFTAEMSLALSRERGSPVLHIMVYTEDGQLNEARYWTFNNLGQW